MARTLESEWNVRLEEVAQLEKEYDKLKQQPPFELSETQRRQLLCLTQDLPQLWRAPTTKPGQRKQLLRLLIEDITLRNTTDPWRIDVAIRWKTGTVTRHRAKRVVVHPHTTSPQVVSSIAELYAQNSDQDIAELLNAEGYRTGYGNAFTAVGVAHIRRRSKACTHR